MLDNEYFKAQFEELYKPYKKFHEYVIPKHIVERLAMLYTQADMFFRLMRISTEEDFLCSVNANLKLNQEFAEDIYRLYKAYYNIKLNRVARRNELDMDKLYTTNLNIFEKMKNSRASSTKK